MSRKYKFHDQSQIYFVSFATVNFIDVFTLYVYRFIIIDSLKYCYENKDLELYAWIIMSNHAFRPCWYEGQAMSAGYQQVIQRAKYEITSTKK
jgi:putative transposase